MVEENFIKKALSFNPKPYWSWWDASKNKFIAYESQISDIIESEFQKMHITQFNIQIKRNSYIINFSSNSQINMETKKQRKIKRIVEVTELITEYGNNFNSSIEKIVKSIETTINLNQTLQAINNLVSSGIIATQVVEAGLLTILWDLILDENGSDFYPLLLSILKNLVLNDDPSTIDHLIPNQRIINLLKISSEKSYEPYNILIYLVDHYYDQITEDRPEPWIKILIISLGSTNDPNLRVLILEILTKLGKEEKPKRIVFNEAMNIFIDFLHNNTNRTMDITKIMHPVHLFEFVKNLSHELNIDIQKSLPPVLVFPIRPINLTGVQFKTKNEFNILSKINNGYLQESDIITLHPDQIIKFLPLLILYEGQSRDLIFNALACRIIHDPKLGQSLYWLYKSDTLPQLKELKIIQVDKILDETYNFFDQFGQRTDLFPSQTLSITPIYDPIFLRGKITSIKILKQFDSSVKPLLLEFYYEDSNLPPKWVIYKNNSDLRRDMNVLLLFSVFNSLWHYSSLREISTCTLITYKVIPIGNKAGLIEFVEKSEPVHTFNWKSIDNLSKEQQQILLYSSAASFAASWVLGIRDRHQHNMMIKDGHQFFHIDFGWIFNRGPTLDATPIAIHQDFKRNTDWDNFKSYCIKAYFLLRNNSGLVTNFSSMLFNFDKTLTDIRSNVTNALMIDLENSEAQSNYLYQIDCGVESWWKTMKWTAHAWMISMKPNGNSS